ncbi:MAG: TrkA family potassium uptake protein [Clostridia bacterium]|nr:TrkA family potassium uptake protein [Clostridia bacterium]
MKSFLIIGVGSFGYHLIKYLSEQQCEILVIDKNEEKLEKILPFATSAKIADCTNADVLASFDVDSFDAAFVCVDSDFVAALEITCLLNDLGAKKIYSCADHDIQARLLSRNGAHYIIYPEKDIAKRTAINVSNESVFDSFELAEDFFVFEIAVKEEWVGKTLRELNFRAKYSVNVLAGKAFGKVHPINSPDYIFEWNTHILVMGTREDMKRLTD